MNSSIEQITQREWPAIARALDALEPPAPEFSATREGQQRHFEWFQSLWSKRASISPGIPAVWPPQAGHGELDYYLAASGMNPAKLSDGERYTAPWGRVSADLATGRFEFVALPWKPEWAGTQGVRPLRPDEARVAEDSKVQEDLGKALAQGFLPPELEARAHAYYGLWRSNHGVAKLIRPRHEQFFSWLREYSWLEPWWAAKPGQPHK